MRRQLRLNLMVWLALLLSAAIEFGASFLPIPAAIRPVLILPCSHNGLARLAGLYAVAHRAGSCQGFRHCRDLLADDFVWPRDDRPADPSRLHGRRLTLMRRVRASMRSAGIAAELRGRRTNAAKARCFALGDRIDCASLQPFSNLALYRSDGAAMARVADQRPDDWPARGLGLGATWVSCRQPHAQFWQVVNLRRNKAFLDVEGTAMSGIKRDKTLEDPRAASGSERPNKPSHRRNTDEQPTGTPTSDRHGTETVHHWEDEHKS